MTTIIIISKPPAVNEEPTIEVINNDTGISDADLIEAIRSSTNTDPSA